MLVPLRIEGVKPPLVMIHGRFGVMPLGQRLVRALDADRPLYAIQAGGFDGEARDSVEEMVLDHLAALRRLRASGPYILGGIGAGCLVALEMARQLRAAGESAASVLMLAPPPVPNLHPPQRDLDPELENASLARTRTAARDWYERYLPTFDAVPHDFTDSRTLERAADIGARLVFALERHRPQPYSGRVDIIASAAQAKLITHAALPWRSEILVGPWSIQAIACGDDEIFLRGEPAMLGTVTKIVQSLDAEPRH